MISFAFKALAWFHWSSWRMWSIPMSTRNVKTNQRRLGILNAREFLKLLYKVWFLLSLSIWICQFFFIETCHLHNYFFLVRHELSIATDVLVQLYYEEVLNEKLKSPSRLHALMDKAMDQVWKDHTSNKSINLEYYKLKIGVNCTLMKLRGSSKLVTMEAQTLFDFCVLTCFIDKDLMRQYELALMKKCTQVRIEVIEGRRLSWRLVTHETKPLNITIGFHTSKVVFNIISSPKNSIIIGLSWFTLHNPWMDWHMRSFHFETPQHEAMECETLETCMEKIKMGYVM
jgi:hypothetical protein